MTVHAFADESRRGSLYFLAAAIAHPANLRQLRRDMRGLLLPDQRELHFNKEKDPRRRQLADAIARLPVEVHIYISSCGRFAEPARQVCMSKLALDLVSRNAHRLVVDTREELDTNDETTIRQAISRHQHHSDLVYEHLDSTNEPLLWIPDAVAWCFGVGGDWKRRICALVTEVSNLGSTP